MSNDKHMHPMSGEQVETDGVYRNEWGREEALKRGDRYPADPMLGNTTWELSELPDEELKQRLEQEQGDPGQPRAHLDNGDK